LQKKAREIKEGKNDSERAHEPRNPFGKPREQSHSVAGNFLSQLTSAVEQIIRDAERGREQAQRRAIREAQKGKTAR
jgi:hypothetical protein